MKDYCVHDFQKISDIISEIRDDLIFNFEAAGISPIAEQQFLVALSLLEQASRSIKIADYYQMKGE